MFGRRRKKRDAKTESTGTEAAPRREGAAGAVSFGNEIEPERPTEQPAKEADRYRATGPWDSAEDVPEAKRMDLGSMLLPMAQGAEIQVNVAQDAQGKQKIIGVTMMRDKSALQVQPFAAPKSSGLWDEMREELREQVVKQGGKVEDHEGTFGPELRALVPVKGRKTEDGKQLAQRVRFIGVDGPRWVLRGVIRGDGASKPEVMSEVEQLFADIVVVRGDQPVPPNELLPITVPKQIQEQMAQAAKTRAAQQAAQSGNAGRSPNGAAPGGQPGRSGSTPNGSGQS
ncbi:MULTISPECIES: DUF3710 domain-containing protein [Nocardiopsis]|uniref:DUF3710 domain-containing protein n=1 Tax=Nocardiopsis sinuspersici TaxID=501010 RepID=A0A1V3C1B8_9ACTN|nr:MULTISPECIES: DUF3710 domain-containing protein [Nocardiopsis]NYH50606.1 hypothetical protein [Nocardiopsis sinuspersici]OOC54473.1 hypothetical protein NOSIN_12200 [Nocardiopsis sinuspersici]